jgi:hypothetical protein
MGRRLGKVTSFNLGSDVFVTGIGNTFTTL